ncbi:hypothetical protein [Streptomyces sp. G1]|uniref:hypothetical protein n=1 Tax=Streptomyces sp. G1 TaxID=361572 RepID=UPI00202EABB1|nr:hypothetical protein [Streptomyces sp. G1]MCM1974594.1 hypothetical protein [Streptomyces sp. G1]
MSGPLVVNTKDGTVWTRRGAFRGGEPLYAPQAICQCPELVMATLPELAEHGIAGTADALPMPVGPEQPLALPWAHAMSDDDLHLFLDDLVSAALNRWRSEPETPDRVTLAEVEKACARWRTPGQGYRSDESEVDVLLAWVAELEAERHSTNESLSEAAEQLRADRDRIAELEARLAEFERPVDEDPIAYELTEQAEVFVPRTERERWVDIANALNAAHAAGMPVGIDLDGTLTDGRMWSVVWDRAAERWTVAGYDDGQPGPEPEPDVTPQVRKLRALLAGQRDAVAANHATDLVTLADAIHAHAACAPHFQAIDLDLTATPEQWSAWQTALSVDLRRTTQRGGGLVTSHATWRGIHVVIRCWLAEQPETAAAEAGDAR